MDAQLSSKGIPQHILLPFIPLGCLSTVNRRPLPEISLQSPFSSSQPLCILGCLRPCPGYIVLWQGLSAWFLPLSECHRSAAALSNGLKCFSSVPNNCPGLGTDPYFSSPIPLPPQVQILSCSPSSSFFPSSLYSTEFLHQSIYSFPVLRYSCPPSTDVLQDLQCLKVYS